MGGSRVGLSSRTAPGDWILSRSLDYGWDGPGPRWTHGHQGAQPTGRSERTSAPCASILAGTLHSLNRAKPGGVRSRMPAAPSRTGGVGKRKNPLGRRICPNRTADGSPRHDPRPLCRDPLALARHLPLLLGRRPGLSAGNQQVVESEFGSQGKGTKY